MMHINHLTLTTGHTDRFERAEVADEVLTVVAPWLREIVNSGQYHALPVPELCHYSAIAYVQDGGLLMTVCGPRGPYTPGKPIAQEGIPLVTFGVAQRSRHAESLWASMLANFAHPPGLRQPSTPWIAVAVHPSMMAYPQVIDWIADFERCCAWAWITRNAQLESIDGQG